MRIWNVFCRSCRLTPQQAFESATRFLAPCISVALVAMTAGQLLQLGRLLTDADRTLETGVEKPAGSEASPAVHEAGVDYLNISSYHIFGISSAEAHSETAASTMQAETTLTLTGTMAEIAPGGGYAIIGDTPATAKLYAVGALLPTGSRLESVYPDRVILDDAGILRVLMLRERSLSGTSAYLANPSADEQSVEVEFQMLSLQEPESTRHRVLETEGL